MKDCLNCGNYDVFYLKDRDHFKKERPGLCDLRKQVVQNHDRCDEWRNNLRKRTVRNKFCRKTLASALINLSQIRQILSEEQEENKIYPFPKR